MSATVTSEQTQLRHAAAQVGEDLVDEQDPAVSREPEGFSPRSDAAPVVVLAGATPGAGTSGVAAAVVGAALGAGLRAHLIDAGCPRRSGLRQLCPVEGRSLTLGGGVSIVSSEHEGLRLDYLDGPLDTRFDDPGGWPVHGGVDLVVIDVGLSVEEALTSHPDACRWLRPPHVPDAWVVLVASSSLPALGRCELVLGRWSPQGLSPVAQVITTGPLPPSERVRGLTGRYVHQALELASHAAWDPLRHVLGISDTTVSDDVSGTGVRILTGLGGEVAARVAPPAAARGRRGFTHRRKD